MSVLVSAEVGVQTESVPLVQTRPAVTNETAPGGSGDLDTCDSSPEFDLKTCQSVSYEKRDGVPGVQYFDEDGQEGWTPVVKKKRKRKPGAGVKEDSEESSDEELPIRAARQAKYKEKEGIPGLSVRYGNTMHSWKWTPIRTTTPIAYRTRTRIKVVNMGTAISETKLMDKWAASKRTQVSAILCIKLLPLLENALKLNFKALYETENLDPLQGPTHTLTPSSIHTQNRPQNYGWIYHLLSSLAGYS